MATILDFAQVRLMVTGDLLDPTSSHLTLMLADGTEHAFRFGDTEKARRFARLTLDLCATLDGEPDPLDALETKLGLTKQGEREAIRERTRQMRLGTALEIVR